MKDTTLREKVKALLDQGVGYKTIAESADCDTSTIYRIKHGLIKDTSYSIGKTIERLYESHIKTAA